MSYLFEVGGKLELGGKIFFFRVPSPHEGLSRQNVWERNLESGPWFCVMENLLLVEVLLGRKIR